MALSGRKQRRSKKRECVTNAKSGHGAEVEGNRSLIDWVEIVTVARLDRVETKLVMALWITTDEFHFIHDGRRLTKALRLEYSDKDHGAVWQHAL
jgi:hypothetical protein